MSTKRETEVTFLSKEEPLLPEEEDAQPIHVREHWEETLAQLANSPGATVRIPRSPDTKRTRVINAFHDAFQLTGGTPRLALWADENPTEFYRLYAKLLPKQIETEQNVDATLRIHHILPRGKLDL